MKVIIKTKGNNLLWLVAYYGTRHERAAINDLYLDVLSGIIIGKSIKAVTIDPRQTSAMYGIENSNEVKIGGSKFLLTTIHNCDSERLKYIISEDEFLRTLLVIVKKDADLTNAELIDLVRLIRNTEVTSSNEIVFCEDDGDSLCLYNTKVDLSELIMKCKTTASEVSVEAI